MNATSNRFFIFASLTVLGVAFHATVVHAAVRTVYGVAPARTAVVVAPAPRAVVVAPAPRPVVVVAPALSSSGCHPGTSRRVQGGYRTSWGEIGITTRVAFTIGRSSIRGARATSE